jgi:hypothetical protein
VRQVRALSWVGCVDVKWGLVPGLVRGYGGQIVFYDQHGFALSGFWYQRKGVRIHGFVRGF